MTNLATSSEKWMSSVRSCDEVGEGEGVRRVSGEDGREGVLRILEREW